MVDEKSPLVTPLKPENSDQMNDRVV